MAFATSCARRELPLPRGVTPPDCGPGPAFRWPRRRCVGTPVSIRLANLDL